MEKGNCSWDRGSWASLRSGLWNGWRV